MPSGLNAIDDTGSGVEVRLTDGTTERVVVDLGADGLRSTVREFVTESGSGTPEVHSLGHAIAVVQLPTSMGLTTEEMKDLLRPRIIVCRKPVKEGGRTDLCIILDTDGRYLEIRGPTEGTYIIADAELCITGLARRLPTILPALSGRAVHQ